MLPTLNNMHITLWGHPFAHKIFQKTNNSYPRAYQGVGILVFRKALRTY